MTKRTRIILMTTTNKAQVIRCRFCAGSHIVEDEPCTECRDDRALCVLCAVIATRTHDDKPDGDPLCEACRTEEDGDDDTVHCDGCQMRILRSEVVSPKDWAENFCCLCLAAVPETEPAPPPADPGRTKRIPNVSMSSMVWGSR